MKLTTIIAMLCMAAALAAATHVPLNLNYRHHSGIVTKMPLDLYPTRTLEIIGIAPADPAVITYWAKRGHQVIYADPCPEEALKITNYMANHQPALQGIYARAQVAAAKYKHNQKKTLGEEPMCNTLIMYNDWQMEYNASSGYYSNDDSKYGESLVTPWLMNQDPSYFDMCPLEWGTFGVNDFNYACNEEGELSSPTKLAFKEGLPQTHGIEARYTFQYTESLVGTHYTRLVKMNWRTIADISFTFNMDFGCDPTQHLDLCPPLDWTCFYYVNKYGQYIPCGFETGAWIQHDLNYEAGDYAVYRRYPLVPYAPSDFIPLTALLFFGQYEYYTFAVPENWQLA